MGGLFLIGIGGIGNCTDGEIGCAGDKGDWNDCCGSCVRDGDDGMVDMDCCNCMRLGSNKGGGSC